MTRPGIDIFGLNASYRPYLFRADWNEKEGDRTSSINSQQEVTTASRLLFHSNDPTAQIDFFKDFLPKIEAAGWQVPAYFRKAFEEQVKTFNDLKAREGDHTLGIGSVPISVPYRLSMEELVQSYGPGWQTEKADNGKIEIVKNEKGEMVLYIVREENEGNFQYIFSPLTLTDLTHALLWMPPYIQNDFASLLGLPWKNVEGVQTYVRRRIESEEARLEPFQREGNQAFDPLCKRNSEDHSLKSPENIREAIMSQCEPQLPKVRFPAFALTRSDFPHPILETHNQNTCIVILIHDRRTTKSLMAHLPTTDTFNQEQYLLEKKLDLACSFRASGETEICCGPSAEKQEILGIGYPPDERSPFGTSCVHETFPLEWYASVFRNTYFSASNDQDVVVTVVKNFFTPDIAVRDAMIALQRYFPGGRIQKTESRHYSTSAWLDSHNGDIYLAPSNPWREPRFQLAEKVNEF